MRTIKFRGKDRYTGEWFFGNYYDKDTKGNTHICSLNKGSLVIDPATVGQFTGLFDKHGKEIYEGDIVTRHGGTTIRDVTGVITYDTSAAMFGIFYTSIGQTRQFESLQCRRVYADGDGASWTETHTFEVIGNIHDNPELMKKEA